MCVCGGTCPPGELWLLGFDGAAVYGGCGGGGALRVMVAGWLVGIVYPAIMCVCVCVLCGSCGCLVVWCVYVCALAVC